MPFGTKTYAIYVRKLKTVPMQSYFFRKKKARETIFTNFVSIHAIQLKNRPYCKHTIAQRGNPENSYTGEILSQQSLSSFFFPNSEYKTFF